MQDVVVHRHGTQPGCPAFRDDPSFGELSLEPFTAPLEGSVDRGRRRRQPALQDLQSEADIVPLPAVTVREPCDAVHLGSDVIGDRGVECGFLGRQFVLGGICTPFWKQRPRIEAKQLFLRQPSHHVGGIGIVDAVAEAAFEAVAIQ